jgi:hypothetical protein
MSLKATIGCEENLFEETPKHCRQLELEDPVIDNAALAKIKSLDRDKLKTVTIPMLYRVADGGAGLEKALSVLCWEAEVAITNGATLLVLTDRGMDAENAPIPALLATAAVHHQLIRSGNRTRCGLVIESGEPREVQHFALLVGYGAGAINP